MATYTITVDDMKDNDDGDSNDNEEEDADGNEFEYTPFSGERPKDTK